MFKKKRKEILILILCYALPLREKGNEQQTQFLKFIFLITMHMSVGWEINMCASLEEIWILSFESNVKIKLLCGHIL